MAGNETSARRRRHAARLPYAALVSEIGALLNDSAVQAPPRLVQPLPGGGSLFVMPALDARVAITKLITLTPANAARGRPPSRATWWCST